MLPLEFPNWHIGIPPSFVDMMIMDDHNFSYSLAIDRLVSFLAYLNIKGSPSRTIVAIEALHEH